VQALRAFIARVRELPRLVIQAHDFPDHDAVSSSYALAHLLGEFGVRTQIVYNGVIDRISLRNMIEQVGIPIVHWREAGLTAADKTITVDGCIGEKNVTDLPGDEIAVIDHHQVTPPPGLWYQDVRPGYGACATILHEYYDALEIALPRDVATALQVGLAIDTANLTRGFQKADVAAFAHFHEVADQEKINVICRNSLLREEVVYYRQLLDALQVRDGVGFVWMADGCPKNMLGVMGDFLMSVHEISTTILAAPDGDTIQLSLRTEHPDVNVGRLVKEVLQQHDLGFGGGHAHMAGGLVQRAKFQAPDPGARLFELFLERLPRR
jgi:nanoRNase/pAp phosphatase (c-di-AMP/oligoRNAs hydrolase)